VNEPLLWVLVGVQVLALGGWLWCQWKLRQLRRDELKALEGRNRFTAGFTAGYASGLADGLRGRLPADSPVRRFTEPESEKGDGRE